MCARDIDVCLFFLILELFRRCGIFPILFSFRSFILSFTGSLTKIDLTDHPDSNITQLLNLYSKNWMRILIERKICHRNLEICSVCFKMSSFPDLENVVMYFLVLIGRLISILIQFLEYKFNSCVILLSGSSVKSIFVKDPREGRHLKTNRTYLEVTMTYFPFNYSSVLICIFTPILTVFCNS
jgi:hypothetical protein